MEEEFLTLKWGTLKSWNFTNKKAQELLKKYFKIGANISRAMQRDTPDQKKIICDIIDTMPGDIYLSWDSIYVSKEDAKKYVMEYK